jgi:hypothetical protein
VLGMRMAFPPARRNEAGRRRRLDVGYQAKDKLYLTWARGSVASKQEGGCVPQGPPGWLKRSGPLLWAPSWWIGGWPAVARAGILRLDRVRPPSRGRRASETNQFPAVRARGTVRHRRLEAGGQTGGNGKGLKVSVASMMRKLGAARSLRRPRTDWEAHDI